MNPQNFKLFVYEKMVNKKDKSGKFPKTKASIDDVSFDLIITKDCDAKLKAEMLKRGITYPVSLVVNTSQYWVKVEEFMRNDGTKGSKTNIYIKDYESVNQDKFKEAESLHDLTNAIKNARNAIANELGEIKE